MSLLILKFNLILINARKKAYIFVTVTGSAAPLAAKAASLSKKVMLALWSHIRSFTAESGI
ncbi:MAG: hypothetical protein B1H12_03280 [Desulfobacteraceae bacterium 4484_190.2]|nr:MAG: hypothetical protein B1H12_03280 [Desulfobacteraceae bacterium 4484_190.2]